MEVEHALLHFYNLDKELNDKDCDKIYRTLTGETAPNTGVRDGETLFQKIRTELPGLTVASFFMVLNIIGKKNVAIKIHDNFHSDFEEILAVKKCIICDNTDESKGKKRRKPFLKIYHKTRWRRVFDASVTPCRLYE